MFDSTTELHVSPDSNRPIPAAQRSIGRYQVQWLLGRGAEGCVYSGFDPDLARRVALKVYEVVNERTEGRLLRAARLAGQLLHPNIVATYDLVRDGSTWVLVNEYLEGEDLDSAELRDGRRRLRALRDIANGMAHAHKRGIAHLDLKLSNVFQCLDGSVKVLDFGLSRDFSAFSTIPLDNAGLVGTPIYMAPEIYSGGCPAPSSDLWSFGVLAFRLLTGRYPFNASTFMDLARAICYEEIPRLSTFPAGEMGLDDLAEPEIRTMSGLVDASLDRRSEVRPSFTEIGETTALVLQRLESS